MTEYPEGQNQRDDSEPEPLSQEDKNASRSLIELFGEEIVRKLFSKTW